MVVDRRQFLIKHTYSLVIIYCILYLSRYTHRSVSMCVTEAAGVAAANASPSYRIENFDFYVPSFTGSPGMLTPSFNAVHGLASPLATSYANSPVTSMPLGFTLPGGSLATGTLRLPGQMTGQTCVLLVSNLNEEVTETILDAIRIKCPLLHHYYSTRLDVS